MKMWKPVIIGLLVMWCIVLLSACGKIEGAPPSSMSTSGLKVDGPLKVFEVQGKSSGFDLKEITVNQGDTVQIKLTNVQGMHSLKIEGYNQEVRGNKTITFVADQAGEFEYHCDISCGKGHKQMTGKLIVLP